MAVSPVLPIGFVFIVSSDVIHVSLEDETFVAYQSIDEKTHFGKSLTTEAGLQLTYLRFPWLFSSLGGEHTMRDIAAIFSYAKDANVQNVSGRNQMGSGLL